MKTLKHFSTLLLLLIGLATISRAYAWGGGRIDALANAFFMGTAAQPVGTDVALVPDMNGDGYDELAIGAAGANRVYVVLGSANGWGLNGRLSTAPNIITYTGDTNGDLAGAGVAGVGDVNGDGFGDLLVGAPGNDLAANNAGAIYIVFGSANLASTNVGTFPIMIGETAADEVGRYVSAAGDVNGDGLQDMLVGVPAQDATGPDAGAVYLILGQVNLGNASLGSKIKYTGEATTNFAGGSIDRAGDVNGDGYADFVVGASGNDDGVFNGGAAYLVLGTAAPAGGSLGSHVQYTSTTNNHLLGHAVAGAGDFNGDGYGDLLLSAPGSATPGLALVLGSAAPTGGTIAGKTFYPGTHGQTIVGGYSYLAAAGDINSDGYSDVVVGSPSETSNTGAMYLLYGTPNPTNTTLNTLPKWSGVAADDLVGITADGRADANGDGRADLLMSSLGNDEGGNNAGGAYLFWGEEAESYRQRQKLTASGNIPTVWFTAQGAAVDFTNGALAGGDVTLTRHLFHPCATDIRLQTPIWSVDSNKMGAGTTVDVRLRYTAAQIAGMNEANLKVWTRPLGQPCAEWVQLPNSLLNTATNQITAVGLTTLGQFTIADAPPSPTAVQQLSTHVATANRVPLPLSMGVLMLALTVGLLRKPRQGVYQSI